VSFEEGGGEENVNVAKEMHRKMNGAKTQVT